MSVSILAVHPIRAALAIRDLSLEPRSKEFFEMEVQQLERIVRNILDNVIESSKMPGEICSSRYSEDFDEKVVKKVLENSFSIQVGSKDEMIAYESSTRFVLCNNPLEQPIFSLANLCKRQLVKQIDDPTYQRFSEIKQQPQFQETQNLCKGILSLNQKVEPVDLQTICQTISKFTLYRYYFVEPLSYEQMYKSQFPMSFYTNVVYYRISEGELLHTCAELLKLEGVLVKEIFQVILSHERAPIPNPFLKQEPPKKRLQLFCAKLADLNEKTVKREDVRKICDEVLNS